MKPMIDQLEAAAKERQREHGKTAPGKKTLKPTSAEVKPQVRDQIAEMFGVGHTTVSQCRSRPHSLGTSRGAADLCQIGCDKSATGNHRFRKFRTRTRRAKGTIGEIT
jgi:hypothetical protein